MAKRIQIYLTDEAQTLVDKSLVEANENFETGTITISDLISEMVVTSKVDIKSLQLKRTNLRRSLQLLSKTRGIDLDSAIKTLIELRNKTNKKSHKTPTEPEAMI